MLFDVLDDNSVLELLWLMLQSSLLRVLVLLELAGLNDTVLIRGDHELLRAHHDLVEV